VVKNSQKLDRFFTEFHFGHRKKSFRKLNKVKFQGFYGFVISLFFTLLRQKRLGGQAFLF